MSMPAERLLHVSGNPLLELGRHGQAIWLDYIRRDLIGGGELQRLVAEDGLSGVTSNPTIFDKAIAGSSDYDEQLRALLETNPSAAPLELFEELEVTDLQMAADVLRPVYDGSGGADGFVSIEVSPRLARDTTGSIAEAKRLWNAVDRPNLMVKIPATPEGIPAIQALTAAGINVNITLMFSLAHYEAVANAFISGLERHPDPRRVSSVASFFVSRVDTVVDRALETKGTPDALALRGRIAIANARLCYQRFREIFSSERWKRLARRGARVQRVLWASTGTKNPAYSDVLYVESLIGPDTINTMPPATLSAFREHGRVRETITEGVDEARAGLEQLERLGIGLSVLTEKLQEDGVRVFSESLDKLLASLEQKRRSIVASRLDRQTMSLGEQRRGVEARLDAWRRSGFARRLWRGDTTLWSPTPVPELADRMGWLFLPETMHEQAAALEAFAERVRHEGFRHAVLLGMGGSSLAPEVFQRTFGNAGHPELIVLDSTHPAAVRGVERRVDLRRTLFLVSSKSGTTTETLSFFRYFWERAARLGHAPGRQFVAITDPGTPLEVLARERSFRHVFSAPADVGGRYSALTVFGLLPAALIGVDVPRLLDQGLTMAESCAFCVSESSSPALTLGAALGELALAGRDKVTFIASPALEAFPVWAEQLIAESTGKSGKGIVPVAGEPLGVPPVYGTDRLFIAFLLRGDVSGDLESRLSALVDAGHPIVRIELEDTSELGQEFFRWEVAVAAAGSVLGIHPFNQPDVQLAKDLAQQAMARPARQDRAADTVTAERDSELAPAVRRLLDSIHPGDYFGVHAYLDPTPRVAAMLQQLRTWVRDRYHVATTVGFGPRFLHSTGQLHKGGPNSGVFLQLVDEPAESLPVAETDYTFGELIRAQADGDYQALKRRGRRVLRVHLGSDAARELQRLVEALHAEVAR